jgi:hypothetical protein
VVAEVPGMLTEREETLGVEEIIQDELEQSHERQAMLATANAGMDIFPDITAEHGTRNDVIIDLTSDNKYDKKTNKDHHNNAIKEEIKMERAKNNEEDLEEETTPESKGL